MKYKIPVAWEICNIIEIEADSFEEACLQVKDQDIPEDGKTVPDSLRVAYDTLDILNDEEVELKPEGEYGDDPLYEYRKMFFTTGDA